MRGTQKIHEHARTHARTHARARAGALSLTHTHGVPFYPSIDVCVCMRISRPSDIRPYTKCYASRMPHVLRTRLAPIASESSSVHIPVLRHTSCGPAAGQRTARRLPRTNMHGHTQHTATLGGDPACAERITVTRNRGACGERMRTRSAASASPHTPARTIITIRGPPISAGNTPKCSYVKEHVGNSL